MIQLPEEIQQELVNPSPVVPPQQQAPVADAPEVQENPNDGMPSNAPLAGTPFGARFADAANSIGVLPGVGGWAKSLIASTLTALPQRPQSRAQQVAGAANGVLDSLGDAAHATDNLKPGQGALSGVLNTLAARGQRLDKEQENRTALAHANLQMLHEQQLIHLTGEAAINSSINAGKKSIADLTSGASPARVMSDGLTSEDLQRQLQTGEFSPTTMTAFPTGRKLVGEDASGAPQYQTTYSAVTMPASVTLDEDAAKRFNATLPSGSTGKFHAGMTLDGATYNSVSQQVSNMEAAASARQKTLEENEIADTQRAQKLEGLHFAKDGEWNNALLHADNDPLKALAAMQSNPGIVSKYPSLFQDVRAAYGEKAFDQLIEQRQKKIEDQTDYLKKLEDDPAQMSGEKAASATVMLQSRLVDPTTPNELKPRIQRLINQAQSAQKANESYEASKERSKMAIADGDPSAAGRLLVEGVVAPSQLVSSRKPEFAQKAFDTAHRLDPSWDAGVAEAQFKVASQAGQSQFFGSSNSLLDKNGTLDQLASIYKQLPNGKIPVLNSIADWEKARTGSGPIAGFAATALGVADDYAKVMGGGVGSDTSRMQALDLIKAASSPEQMQSAINSIRGAVQSQRDARFRNPYLRKMYGDQPTQQTAQPPQQSQLPQAAVAHLKEGVHTKFVNGQTWTVQSGKPVQVR